MAASPAFPAADAGAASPIVASSSPPSFLPLPFALSAAASGEFATPGRAAAGFSSDEDMSDSSLLAPLALLAPPPPPPLLLPPLALPADAPGAAVLALVLFVEAEAEAEAEAVGVLAGGVFGVVVLLASDWVEVGSGLAEISMRADTWGNRLLALLVQVRGERGCKWKRRWKRAGVGGQGAARAGVLQRRMIDRSIDGSSSTRRSNPRHEKYS